MIHPIDRSSTAALRLLVAGVFAAALGGCGAAPDSPQKEEPIAIRVDDLVSGRVGQFRLSEVPGSSPGGISHPPPFLYASAADGTLQLLFDDTSPVWRVRYVLRDSTPGDPLGAATVVGTISELRPELSAQHLVALAQRGLGPRALTGVHGSVENPRASGPALLASTQRPDVWLGYRDGALVEVLHAAEPTFLASLPGFASANRLAGQLRELKQVGRDHEWSQRVAVLQQSIAVPGLEDLRSQLSSPSQVEPAGERTGPAETSSTLRAALSALAANPENQQINPQAWLDLADDERERAFTSEALIALNDPEIARWLLPHLVELFDAVKRVPRHESPAETIAAWQGFADEHVRFGVVPTRIAARITLADAKTLAADAAQLAAADQPARAAEAYLRAATVGDRESPSPANTLAVRDQARRIRAADSASFDESPAAWRGRWLNLARRQALRAIARSLPPTASDPSVASLQARFVARQLGGDAPWVQRFGLRLSSQSDVQRARLDTTRIALRNVAGRATWTTELQEGTALDLSRTGVGEADWNALISQARALEQSRVDFEVARAALSSSRGALRDEARALDDEAEVVEASIQNGELSITSGRQRLEQISRRRRALSAATRNFDSRMAYELRTRTLLETAVRAYDVRSQRLRTALRTAFDQFLADSTKRWIEADLTTRAMPDEERAAQRRLVLEGALQLWTHPDTLALRVRDQASAPRAAALLRAELDLRLADRSLSSADQVRRLQPAWDSYALVYGPDAFVTTLLRSVFSDRLELHDLIAEQATGPRRELIDQARGVSAKTGR